MYRKRPRQNKYGNCRVEYDGEMFDSKAELLRYLDLKTLEKAKVIYDLQRQVPFELQPGHRNKKGKYVKPIVYVADFVYWKDGERIIEDVKSDATKRDANYRTKNRMMSYRGWDITEV